MRRWVVLLLVLNASCVFAPTKRRALEITPATRYSPGDGLVVLSVTSSTTAIEVSKIQATLYNVDFDYEVVYDVPAGRLLIEPGRYELRSVSIGDDRADVGIGPFEVRSGSVIVLPRLVAAAESEAKVLRLAPDDPVDVDALADDRPDRPWAGRPTRHFAPPSAAPSRYVLRWFPRRTFRVGGSSMGSSAGNTSTGSTPR